MPLQALTKLLLLLLTPPPGICCRCHWLEDGVRGAHCVLSRHTVVQLLLGSSPFTQAALQVRARMHSVANM